MVLCQPGRPPGGGVQAPHSSGRWSLRTRLVCIHPPQPRAWPWQATPRGPPGLALGPPTRVPAGPAVTLLAESTHAAQGTEAPPDWALAAPPGRVWPPAPHPRRPALSLNRCFSLGCECRNHPNLGGPHPGAVGTKLRLSCPEAEGGRRDGAPLHTHPQRPAPQTKGAGRAWRPPAWPRALEFGPTPGGHLQALPQGRGQP